MFARFTTAQLKIDKLDDAVRVSEKSIAPAAQSQKGFLKFSMFTDRETGKVIFFTLWETKEDAIANEKSLYYQEQILKIMPFLRGNPIREGFEVTVDVK
jgi:heme-degrading monooxygenase HmoA